MAKVANDAVAPPEKKSKKEKKEKRKNTSGNQVFLLGIIPLAS